MMASSAEAGRSVYEVSFSASDTEQAENVVAGIFCPDPDHAPPCPVPWSSRRGAIDDVVHFIFYTTYDQAQEILAEIIKQGFAGARLFTSTDADGLPIDGDDVIEQFHNERSMPES
jgi:hypothetical protein